MSEDIVVGLSASPSGRLALEFAARRAHQDGRRLRAINVSGWDPAAASHAVAIEAMFHAVAPEPSWRLQLEHGWPGEVLVRESDGAALLVVGHFDSTHTDRPDAASVSHYCLTHARCPVVGIRRPDDRRLSELRASAER